MRVSCSLQEECLLIAAFKSLVLTVDFLLAALSLDQALDLDPACAFSTFQQCKQLGSGCYHSVKVSKEISKIVFSFV